MVWTPEQAGAFLDHVEDHDVFVYPIVALILHRGLRRGEALGLRENDVDLAGRTATITQQLTTVGYRPVIKVVKSYAGDRIIALDASTTMALRIYQERRERWRADAAWPKTELFFVRPDGRQWHPGQVSDRFERLVADSGLPPIRLHDLRHCAATLLKASGSDLRDIQEVLGLSSITVAANTYTSVVHELESERAKAEAASALVPRRPGAAVGAPASHSHENDSGGPDVAPCEPPDQSSLAIHCRDVWPVQGVFGQPVSLIRTRLQPPRTAALPGRGTKMASYFSGESGYAGAL
jgi:Phage integrase family